MTKWRVEAEAACAAATEGPWIENDGDGDLYGVFTEFQDLNAICYLAWNKEPLREDDPSNARFIALSRIALPRALAKLRAADELADLIAMRVGDAPVDCSDSLIKKALAAYQGADE